MTEQQTGLRKTWSGTAYYSKRGHPLYEYHEGFQNTFFLIRDKTKMIGWLRHRCAETLVCTKWGYGPNNEDCALNDYMDRSQYEREHFFVNPEVHQYVLARRPV